MNFGLIRERCEKKKISIAELERRAGISEKQIYKWQQKGYSPSAEKVQAVATVLNVSVKRLLEDGVQNEIQN